MVVLKILFMLITVAIMAVPFIIEYFRFRKDEESLNVTRFRLIVFTAIYAVASTVVLLIVTRLFAWIGSWGVIQWILHNIGIGKYEDYTTSVYMVIIVNVLFGFGFFIMQSLVRIGLSKMNVVVKKNEEGFTAVQRFERKLVERFRVQKWYFVGRLLKYLSLLLSGVFAALFIIFQIPAVFSADWIPYGFISSLFKLSYQYPVIALFLLWESAFFLLGIHAFSERCPDWEENNRKFKDSREDKIRAIDEDCKKNFNAFYASSMELKGRDPVYFTNHENVSKIIKDIVENDPRNGKTAKEVFVNALDRMEKTNNGILFNGGFFSEFSMYFFRYLSIRLARGDNLIFVCNRDRQSEKLYQYLHKGLCEISSLYYANSLDDQLNRDLENPIWKIVVVDGMRDDIDEHEINGASILITTPDFLCSDVFEERNADFISYLDTVIFTDTMNSINFYEKHLSLLNTKLKHMIENAGQNPICARPVRYFFFDDTRTPGIDKVLNNMFSAEIETVDIMENCYRSIVSCYKYDGVSEDGEGAELPHFIPSDENLSVMLEVAINCIAGGASSVSVFVDEALPYKAIEESISAHIHKLGNVSLERNLHINEYYYNPDQYSVILALDAGNNLPSALRKYISVTTDKPSLVILFSRPYLLRDYYIDNMEKLWQGNQILRIPITEGTEKDIAQKILMEANSGGISKEELLRLASKMNGFEPYVQSRSINKILEKILEIFGIHCSGSMDVYRYFEYTSFRNFDRAGKYSPETKISLRSKGMLYDIIRVQDHITLHAGNHETYDLPLPKKRLAQNFIEGQNLIYQGKIYSIHKVDTKKGEVFGELAGAGYNNEVYSYIQARTYRLDCSPAEMEYLYPSKRTVISQQRKRGKAQSEAKLNEVAIVAFRTPAEVETNGYYDVEPHSMDRTACEYYHPIDGENDRILAVQNYRCYGAFPNPKYTRQKLIDEQRERDQKKSRFYGNRKLFDIPLNISRKGIAVLSVRFYGEFGANRAKITSLAAVMLDEILRAKFPSVADSLAVCAVNGVKNDLTAHLPEVEFLSKEYVSEDNIELMIIEDCSEDLGVISVLMSSGDNILQTLFSPVKDYLDWYMQKEDRSRDYLWFGQENEPDCFDFAGLHALASIVGDAKNKFHYQDVEEIAEYRVCDFCGKRYADSKDVARMEDDRTICRNCMKTLVGNDKTTLKAHLERAKTFMEMTYGIALDNTYEFCYDSTLKIIHAIKTDPTLRVRNTEITPKSYIREKTVAVQSNLPSANLSELLVRELTHIWQIQNCAELEEGVAQGHVALVGIQYLRHLNQTELADVRTHYYESAESGAAEGYRNLTSELMKNPQYNNNPFSYLLGEEQSGERIRKPDPKRTYGETYRSEGEDRSKDNLKYYYYESLPEAQKVSYMNAYEAIRDHAADYVDTNFTDGDTLIKVLKCVQYDHPELFWMQLKCQYSSDGTVTPVYTLTKEEADDLNARMEPVVAEYLADITDDMSAYDVALKLYIKLINHVDYDSIALDRQNAEVRQADELDELRTICGVFLNEKCVCEGYARAYQYLLQKCGIESAECAGHLTKDGGVDTAGTGHAWNLLKLDGDYYYADVTWGDSSNTNQDVKDLRVGFNYFCVTTEELLRTRVLDMSPISEFPEFTATKCNYHYHNDLVLQSYDFKKIKNIVTSAIKKGDDFCTFKCATSELYDEVNKRLFESPEANENLWEVARKAKSGTKLNCTVNKDIWSVSIYID